MIKAKKIMILIFLKKKKKLESVIEIHLINLQKYGLLLNGSVLLK